MSPEIKSLYQYLKSSYPIDTIIIYNTNNKPYFKYKDKSWKKHGEPTLFGKQVLKYFEKYGVR